MRRLLAALVGLVLPLAAALAAPPEVDPRFDALSAAIRAKMLSDPAGAVQDAEHARVYALARPAGPSRDLMMATASWLRGEALIRTGQNEQARPLLNAAVREARAVAPASRLLADALLSRGGLETVDGEVAAAMVDLHAAHNAFRKLGDSRGRARAFAQIANLYFYANDWDTALRYFAQALDAYHADPGLALSIYNGQGLALLNLKRNGEAGDAFMRALRLARELKSPILTATVLKNVAWTHLKSGQVRPAVTAIRESIALAGASAPPEFRRRQLALLAQAMLQKRDLAAAETLLARVFAGVDLRRTELADRDSHQTAYDVFSALGRDGPALAHLTALKRLDDEATELARSNRAALMAARFDFANQELRIEKLKAEDLRKSVAFERARARSQRLALLGVVGGTVLIVSVLAFALITLRRSRDRVRAANIVLGDTNIALEKALAAKTEFLATTSHEIRTPLNGILGMTQVILTDPRVDGATRDRVSVVHGAGVTMKALVDDILDVAKMETGNLTIEEAPFDLATALSEATRMWVEQASAKGLAFAVNLDGCPGTVLGDAARLRQIVFNLLSNAVKFTADGSIRVKAARLGDRLEIAVRDTGIGIAPDRHEEIFESFRQADTSTTRQFGGTGLGLTICRNLARAMGGDVTVASDLGAGATFTLSVPLVEVASVVAERAEAPLDTLVVDRNPIARAKLRSLIAPVVGQVEAVADLDSAVARLAGARARWVVIDDAALGLPDEAPSAVRRLAAATEEGAILILRQEGGAVHAALLDAGAAIVLDRPLARETLLAALDPASSDDARWTVVTRAA